LFLAESESESESEESETEDSDSKMDVDEPSTSTARPKRGVWRTRKAPAGKPKKKPAAGKGKQVKRAGKTKVVKRGPAKQSFMEKVKNENEIHFEHEIGGEFVVRLSTWFQNDKPYISIRKGNSFGATFPAAFYNELRIALDKMKKKFGEMLVED